MSKKLSHYVPTEAELDTCEHNMTMAQLKDPKGLIFAKMPKSVLVNGKRIPRTALRKRDLCKLYLSLGGTIGRKQRRVLKHYSQPSKPSIEQRRYEKILEQRSLDHTKKTSLTKKRHASLSPSKHASSLQRQMNKLKLGKKSLEKNDSSVLRQMNKLKLKPEDKADEEEEEEDEEWESDDVDADY